MVARATNPFEKTKETQTIEKAKSREALAVNWTDGLYLPIFLEKNLQTILITISVPCEKISRKCLVFVHQINA